MTQEKPGEVECPACDGNGKTRQPAAPAEPAWKYAGINLNPEHFETFAPEENAHEGRGLDGSAGTGVDSGVGGKHRTGNVPIEELIERSSLGTQEAKAMRANTPRSVVDAVLKRADELSKNAPAEGEREVTCGCGYTVPKYRACMKCGTMNFPELSAQTWLRMNELEAHLAAATAEIARLRGLCLRTLNLLPVIDFGTIRHEKESDALIDDIRSALAEKEAGDAGR